MKILFKISLLYTVLFSIIGLLLGIYKLFELSYLVGLFGTLVYVASIVIVVTLLARYIDSISSKLKPIIKLLKKLFK